MILLLVTAGSSLKMLQEGVGAIANQIFLDYAKCKFNNQIT